MASILCVDDEPAMVAMLEEVLAGMGHSPMVATSAGEALAMLEREQVDLVLTDYQMPRMSGLELMRALEERGKRVPVVVLTGHATIENAVLCMRSGAVDYLTKPFGSDTLEVTITHALEFARLRRENEVFKQELTRIRSRRGLVGTSLPFRRVLETIASVAPTRATVMLEGESGTGKELFARAIHDQSPRRDAPFISVNCAALPEGLVESVLFGHEKGAFTGATTRTAGAFERAHGGTLLLDEISEMRLDLQSKLLRVIQEQEFERVGGRELIHVDVRIVATTNRDLKAEVEAGKFRADLYYRLHVMPIATPPLRERVDDIPLLTHHFVKVAADRLGVEPPVIEPEAIELACQYQWPGNVRELSNAVERAVILAHGRPIGPELFRLYLPASGFGPLTGGLRLVTPVEPAVAAKSAEGELPLDLSELERIAIDRALKQTGGNRTRAARLLGISERTLRNKLNSPVAAQT